MKKRRKWNKYAVLASSVAISLVAATHRWSDTAHAIALVTAKGGVVRHGFTFPPGPGRKTLIASVAFLPPYRGDVRVALEGSPPLDWELHLSEPGVDVGVRKLPRLEDRTLLGIEPTDSVTLWAIVDAPECDPVCGMKREPRFARYQHEGHEFFFCSADCLASFRADPAAFADKAVVEGRYELALYDRGTDRPLVRIPVSFGTEEGASREAHAH